jgi:hypothetical protein
MDVEERLLGKRKGTQGMGGRETAEDNEGDVCDQRMFYTCMNTSQ